MDEYVSLKKFTEFTTGVIQYMKRHSGDLNIVTDLKNRLSNAENEIISLRKENDGLTKFAEKIKNESLNTRTITLEDEINLLKAEKQQNAKDIKYIENKLILIQKKQVNLAKEPKQHLSQNRADVSAMSKWNCHKCD